MAARTLKLACIVLAAAGICSAQRGQVDVKGSVGFQGFVDESLENHGLVGGSVRFYVTRRFAIEPEFLYLKGSNGHYDVALTPMLVYEWGSGRVRPYVTGGVGLSWSRFGGFGRASLYTEGYVAIGGGAKIYLNDRWFVAPDFRIGWEPHVRVSGGIGYTFRP